MRRFFNVFIGNLCYYRTRQYDTWIFKTEDYMPKLPQLYDHDTSVLIEGRYRYGTHGVRRLLLFKFRRRYIILRHILVDRLLPGWQRLFIFKVLLGRDFLTGLRVHVRMGCQEPFFAFVSL